MTAEEWTRRAARFEKEAHKIFSQSEDASSRVITVRASFRKLQPLLKPQQETLTEALNCVERGLFRAAHVLAWSALMAQIEDKLADGNFSILRQRRPKWILDSVQDLRENVPEFQIVEAARDCRLISKSYMKGLHGLLNKRNECAHPSDYAPALNATLGYVDETITRSVFIASKVVS